MNTIQQLNKDMFSDIKRSKTGRSHGLDVFIQAIEEAQEINWQRSSRDQIGSVLSIPNRIVRIEKFVTVYFTWVTDNRLMAHIIRDGRLWKLRIPEAGYRLYATHKRGIRQNGYQVNGGGLNKPFHILEAMVAQAKKHTNVNSPLVNHIALPSGPALSGYTSWQDYIGADVIN